MNLFLHCMWRMSSHFFYDASQSILGKNDITISVFSWPLKAGLDQCLSLSLRLPPSYQAVRVICSWPSCLWIKVEKLTLKGRALSILTFLELGFSPKRFSSCGRDIWIYWCLDIRMYYKAPILTAHQRYICLISCLSW